MKKIRIICEEACTSGVFGKQLLGGLLKELKKRRISYEQTAEISAGTEACIIGRNSLWTERMIAACNEKDIVPVVLCSRSDRVFGGQYHLVCTDTERAALELKAALKEAGRTKTALYGANLLADTDKDRMEVMSGLVSDQADIYTNTGNLEQCFLTFLPKARYYDAVICVNGYAAVSLVKKLEKEAPQTLETLVVITFEEVLKHSKYDRWLNYVGLHPENYGKAAFGILSMAADQTGVSQITLKMKAELCHIPKLCHETECFADVRENVEDPEIISMAKIEQLLCDADDLDHHIIAMLLSHATYAQIAESCYMAEGNIKYRVKKYMGICGCKSKKELLELLQEYLQ